MKDKTFPKLVPGFDDGITLRLLLWECRSTYVLCSSSWCEGFLLQLADRLTVKSVAGPFSYKWQENEGISAVLIIEESHLAIHTWPEQSAARIVVDSCVNFNLVQIIEWIKEVIEAKHVSFRYWAEDGYEDGPTNVYTS